MTILAFVDGLPRKVHVTLQESEHQKAVTAYQRGATVTCSGELTRQGSQFVLQNRANSGSPRMTDRANGVARREAMSAVLPEHGRHSLVDGCVVGRPLSPLRGVTNTPRSNSCKRGRTGSARLPRPLGDGLEVGHEVHSPRQSQLAGSGRR